MLLLASLCQISRTWQPHVAIFYCGKSISHVRDAIVKVVKTALKASPPELAEKVFQLKARVYFCFQFYGFRPADKTINDFSNNFCTQVDRDYGSTKIKVLKVTAC